MAVTTRISQHPKVYLSAPYETADTAMRVKIEMNTFERSSARPLTRRAYRVDSDWFSGTAQVQTYELAELVATKIRALFQRSKGRDLFDLWLALTELDVTPSDIVECFEPYRPARYTRARAEQNLAAKLASTGFRTDLDPLVTSWPDGYDIDIAGALVGDELIGRL